MMNGMKWWNRIDSKAFKNKRDNKVCPRIEQDR